MENMMMTNNDLFGEEFHYFDEYPQDDPFTWIEDDVNLQSLHHKEEVVSKLRAQIQEFLTFGTARELIKVVNEELNG